MTWPEAVSPYLPLIAPVVYTLLSAAAALLSALAVYYAARAKQLGEVNAEKLQENTAITIATKKHAERVDEATVARDADVKKTLEAVAGKGQVADVKQVADDIDRKLS